MPSRCSLSAGSAGRRTCGRTPVGARLLRHDPLVAQRRAGSRDARAVRRWRLRRSSRSRSRDGLQSDGWATSRRRAASIDETKRPSLSDRRYSTNIRQAVLCLTPVSGLQGVGNRDADDRDHRMELRQAKLSRRPSIEGPRAAPGNSWPCTSAAASMTATPSSNSRRVTPRTPLRKSILSGLPLIVASTKPSSACSCRRESP